MSADGQTTDDGVAHPCSGGTPLYGDDEEARRERGEKEQQRVGARLLGEGDEEAVQSEEQPGEEGDSRAEEAPAEPVDDRHRGNGEDRRGGSKHGLARAHPLPEVEQGVIQAHVGVVVTHGVVQTRPGQLGDHDAVALVDIEALAADEQEIGHGADGHQADKGPVAVDPTAASGFGLCFCRLARAKRPGGERAGELHRPRRPAANRRELPGWWPGALPCRSW